MKFKKIGWLIFSCLVIAGLVLASCGPTNEEAEEEEVTAEEEEANVEEEEEVAEEEEVSSDEPQYGGTVRIIEQVDTRTFDDVFWWSNSCWSLALTNEELHQGDWARGPAGTGEVSWGLVSFEGMENYTKSGVAESWEVDKEGKKMIFHIRKGIYWAQSGNDASQLVNGREMTADDVVFSIIRNFNHPASFAKAVKPNPISVTATDKWTVEVEFATFANLTDSLITTTDLINIFPPEAVEAYGDLGNWQNSVGTGPYMLTDYVKGSSITMTRNPNYWDTDPVGPGMGNQLPYLDGVKILIIPDVSTQMAAMRTGKADQMRFRWEDAASLRETNPELMMEKAISSTRIIHMREDNPEFPWTNLKVRQAMHMAIDYQAIVDDFYGGDAEFYTWPSLPTVEFKDIYVPLEDLPENVQELFAYNPEKAQQLLDEAGYGDGFTIEVVCRNVDVDVDVLSIYKNYWSQIGVDLVIDQKDNAVYNSIYNAQSFNNAILGSGYSVFPFFMNNFTTGNRYNGAFISDPRIDQVHTEIWDEYLNWDYRCELYRDITPYLLENAWYIQTPAYYTYTVWQPWVKDYHGEFSVGNANDPNWAKWVWVDQDLKEEMTGSR